MKPKSKFKVQNKGKMMFQKGRVQDTKRGLTRKERRKTERQEKKQKKDAYFRQKTLPKKAIDSPDTSEEEEEFKPSETKMKTLKQSAKSVAGEVKDYYKAAAKRRNLQLKEANVEEEKNINMLEKLLKIKKKRNKNLFANDGLGYILEVLDQPEGSETMDTFVKDDLDSELGDDLDKALGHKKSLIEDENMNSDESEFSDDEDLDFSDMSEESSEEIKLKIEKESKEKKILKGIETGVNEKLKKSKSYKKDCDEIENGVHKKSKSKKVKNVEVFEDKNKTRKRKTVQINETNENDCSELKENKRKRSKTTENETVSPKEKPKIKKSNLKSEQKGKIKNIRWADEDSLPIKAVEMLNTSISDEELGSDEEFCSEEDEENSETETEIRKSPFKGDGYWEDIYGRKRDREGNVVKPIFDEAKVQESLGDGKYVPPAKRALMMAQDSKKKEALLHIKRQLKGLLNRVSEANMKFIADQVEDMYRRHSRNDMNESLSNLFLESVVSPSKTPERLVMEHAMLLALLHGNVGSEVGAHCLQTFVTQLNNRITKNSQDEEGKETDNLLLLVCHLYTFKISHCVLIFDIVNVLTDKFDEKSIQLILLVLKSVGFSLRRDDPAALKEMILRVQSKVSQATHLADQSKIRFMLETLMAIKNNNMQKIPNYDPTLAEHMKKVKRGLLRKGSDIQELHISLSDLLKAGERGRWWIVGSAWQGVLKENEEDEQEKGSFQSSKFEGHVDPKLLDLARGQRMNTESRKNIFCIIMSAEDFMDAFEKLLRLGLKNQQEREIIHVILDCCLQEKIFNPFYGHLANKFCSYERRFQMTLQFALWDKFKDLKTLPPRKLTNLARFIVHLLVNGALPLSVLKVIQLSEMEKSMVKFLRQVMLAILLNDSDDVCTEVFGRIASAPKLRMFREGLRLFMRHFLLRNQEKMDPEIGQKLKKRVDVAENALAETDRKR